MIPAEIEGGSLLTIEFGFERSADPQGPIEKLPLFKLVKPVVIEVVEIL